MLLYGVNRYANYSIVRNGKFVVVCCKMVREELGDTVRRQKCSMERFCKIFTV